MASERVEFPHTGMRRGWNLAAMKRYADVYCIVGVDVVCVFGCIAIYRTERGVYVVWHSTILYRISTLGRGLGTWLCQSCSAASNEVVVFMCRN